MKKLTIIAVLLSFGLHAEAQSVIHTEEITLPADLETIKVQKLADDPLSTSFIIWVKTEVAPHYHAHHTEEVYILEGMGVLTMGKSVFNIKPGDYIIIPSGTVHSVRTISKTPLKVISMQSPSFDGSDRVWVE
jgi:mannose-6-phosphate isomerase-like protein (cupin superfamily)